jgi:hypothetical protein
MASRELLLLLISCITAHTVHSNVNTRPSMTAQLIHIRNVLQTIVMHFIEGQRINLEGVYHTRLYAAETHLRVIANKRLLYLLF